MNHGIKLLVVLYITGDGESREYRTIQMFSLESLAKETQISRHQLLSASGLIVSVGT